MLNRIMYRFSVWFASPVGVLQTFLITSVWVIVERVFPSIDRNGFWLLYILTLYSAQTQPILAYAANVSATKSESVLSSIRDLQTSQNQMMKNQTDMMNALLTMMQAAQAEIHEIAEDTEELTEEE